MHVRTNLLIDAVILVAYMAATNPAMTGTPAHEWLGIGVALLCFVHLVMHWAWTVHAVRRLLGRLGAISRVNLAVGACLLLATVTVAMSGLMVSRAALAGLSRTVADDSIWHVVHSKSSTALLALVGLHMGLHWSWIASTLRRWSVGPFLRPKASHAEAALRSGAVSDPVSRRLAVGTASTLAALLLVGVVAGAVWTVAPSVHQRFGWLVLPARAELARPQPVRPTSASDTPYAAGFDGTTAQRMAVRTSHTLVLLALATALGVTVREYLRPA